MNNREPSLQQKAFHDQRQASDPQASAWVSASAGTGKTKVLTDRVLRLLLDGTKVSTILCLTYTKAAASEMVNRILERMLAWVVNGQEFLEKDLMQLLGVAPAKADIVRARQLFFQVLDDPIGLQASTMHSFCQSLLERFPLEAGISPGFQVMEETEAKLLVKQALEDTLQEIRETARPDLRQALHQVTSQYSWSAFIDMMGMLRQNNRFFHQLLDEHQNVENVVNILKHQEGIENLGDSELIRQEFYKKTKERLKKHGIRSDFSISKTTFGKTVEKIQEWVARASGTSHHLQQYVAIFLTKEETPRKELEKIDANSAEGAFIHSEIQACVQYLSVIRAEQWIGKISNLLVIYQHFDTHYQLIKRRNLSLDYQDLVRLVSRFLLSTQNVSWVLYKLDNHINHVLLDEAQDSNSEQWQMIETLVQEFFAGRGQRQDNRTVFAVGDVKQSIYGFLQAEPAEFLKANHRFHQYTQQAAKKWRNVDLDISFRSTKAILEVVDAVFTQPQSLMQQQGFKINHIPNRQEAGGIVELWPMLQSKNPLNGAENADIVLAQAIARRIKKMLSGEMLASQGRPIQARDIMILVQRRKPLTSILLNALRQQEVPVAGVDRLALKENMGINDLVAIGKFCLLPQDDFNLAIVLKGPLGRLTEEDLLDLCHGRSSSLWQNLKQKKRDHPPYQPIHEMLLSLLSTVDYQRPYHFYINILDHLGMRSKLLAELGTDIHEAIDEFLHLALNFEEQGIGTLQEFIDHLEESDAEIKRDLEQPILDHVRLMTIHGAKGLQAPIVFLAQTLFVNNLSSQIFWDDQKPCPLPIMVPGKGQNTEWQNRVREKMDAKILEEQERLLYVAMTRAEDRLYIGGSMTTTKSRKNWHDFIRSGMEKIASSFDLSQSDADWPASGLGLRIDCPQTIPLLAKAPPAPVLANSLPVWWKKPIVERNSPVATMLPSGEQQSHLISPLSEDGKQSVYLRGQIIHQLLQMAEQQPPADFQETAKQFLARAVFALPIRQQQEILQHINSLLGSPLWQSLRMAENLYEAPIQGFIPKKSGERVHITGRIDRLAIFDKEIWIMDYKTHHALPRSIADVPAEYFRQMAIYRSLISQIYPPDIYPPSQIRCFLLWTAKPLLMELENDLLNTYIIH